MRFVGADWVRERLGSPEIQLLDPRLRVRYTSGHLQGALHVPIAQAFGPDGRLLPDEQLARWLAACGVRDDLPAVVYDQGDGQAGAMLAWILEYVGHPDVRFMRQSFETWRAGGNELFYRPVNPPAGHINLRPQLRLRASRHDLLAPGDVTVIDTRSPEEFSGELVQGEDLPGHIPGATNLPWLAVVAGGPDLYVSRERLSRLLVQSGVATDRPSIVYCRVGTRAAVVTMAMLEAGYPARLYDGSWSDWQRHDGAPRELIPAEGSERSASGG